MKIKKSAITTLANEGRITLQIPQLDIIADKSGKMFCINSSESVDAIYMPDKWFIHLKSSKQPAFGKEKGFLFLTEAGWKANKKDIKKAFNNSPHKRGTWQEFEKYAETHFKKVKDSLKKRVKYLEKKAKEAKHYFTGWISGQGSSCQTRYQRGPGIRGGIAPEPVNLQRRKPLTEKSPITGEYNKTFNPQARMMDVEIAITEAIDQLEQKI